MYTTDVTISEKNKQDEHGAFELATHLFALDLFGSNNRIFPLFFQAGLLLLGRSGGFFVALCAFCRLFRLGRLLRCRLLGLVGLFVLRSRLFCLGVVDFLFAHIFIYWFLSG